MPSTPWNCDALPFVPGDVSASDCYNRMLLMQDEEDFEDEVNGCASVGNGVLVQNSLEVNTLPGPIERLVERAETNTQNACRFKCDPDLLSVAGALEASIRDWNKFCPNDIMNQLIVLFVRFDFIPDEARVIVCDCSRGIVDSLESQMGLLVDHPLAQGFWKVLRSRAFDLRPERIMQRWTIDEICASACCPGCGCEVTSNYCMAGRYANMNALTARWSCKDLKNGDVEFGELNECASSSMCAMKGSPST